VDPPYLLAGVSGGGFYAFHYAGRFRNEVAGLMLIDTPVGQAKMSAEDVKELAWDNQGNPEHIDYVAVEHQMAVARLPIPPVPVTVVTGRFGQSKDDLDSQKVWLKGASPRKQVILETGHDVDHEDPAGLSEAMLDLLDLVSR
jgi:pimeloyl-ACP methyl ester carboxylesterase